MTTEEARRHNRRLAKKRAQWLNEHFTSYQLLCWTESLVLRNPLLRQAPNRYRLPTHKNRNYVVMNTYKTISSENLHNLLIVEGIENSVYQKAEILQIAICDYPGPVQEPIDYLNILENEIGNPLTFDRINAFQSKLDLKTDAWKAESLSVVLHTFNDDKNVTLNELLEELSSFYFTNINNFGSL